MRSGSSPAVFCRSRARSAARFGFVAPVMLGLAIRGFGPLMVYYPRQPEPKTTCSPSSRSSIATRNQRTLLQTECAEKTGRSAWDRRNEPRDPVAADLTASQAEAL